MHTLLLMNMHTIRDFLNSHLVLIELWGGEKPASKFKTIKTTGKLVIQ